LDSIAAPNCVKTSVDAESCETGFCKTGTDSSENGGIDSDAFDAAEVDEVKLLCFSQ
jgi:hypothetical protein